MAAPLNVGIVGFGNIGTGVVRALETNRAVVESRVPHPIRVTRIVDIDTTTRRDANYDPAILSNDTEGLLADPDVHVVLELTGTMDFARDLIDRALQAKKNVVTANKALIASHGVDLIRTAVANKVCLLFEGAVGGGIPLLRTLHQGLSPNEISAVRGILNGTANFILTRMCEEGADGVRASDFQTALLQAQEMGCAEPDPTFDVEGHDTAHKLSILATLCFGQDIRFEDIFREGITQIRPIDVVYTRQMGYAIKLLGIAKRDAEGRVEARVHPTLLPIRSRLASVGDVYNAIRFDGNLTGSVILSGKGAGPEPTSSAILSDLMVLASGKAEGGLRREMRLCLPKNEKRLRPIEELETRYYIRFGLADVAGALAQVFTILASHDVSVASMIQPAEHDDDYAPILVVTHEAREAKVQKALAHVRTLEISQADPFLLRIEDMG
ncbi:MAG TPA: homoserine dehydrogenase [Sumerlaeia bacterium]|nr:homoserine dehydrogenase [Sumerlaeia bacterium]